MKRRKESVMANNIFKVFLILATLSGSNVVQCQNEFLQSRYSDSSSYYDRYLLDSPYNLCRDPLMHRAEVTATSEASQRTSVDSKLWGGSAWVAENSDFQQALIIDLGLVKNVTGIATQVNLKQ